ncbi:MAG: hypothetical protein ACI91V_000611 [Lentimonas sp.]|jgi:hypothetical protein
MSRVGINQTIGSRVQPLHHDSFLRALLIFALVVFIAVIPKTRIVFGAPLYFVDGLILLIFINVFGRSSNKTPEQKKITRMAVFYWAFISLSEVRGGLTNSTYMESMYMVFRFTLAISMIFLLPRIVVSKTHIITLLKAIVVSLLATSSLAILTSLPPTKGTIEGLVFSINLINPGGAPGSFFSGYIESVTHAGRGKSLVGVSVVTAGFLGAFWPFAILASSLKSAFNPVWRRLVWMASILAPLGILATYGRTAWVIVITLGLMLILFNYAKGRRTFIFALMLVAWAVAVYGIYSKLFYVERIVMKTAITLNAPFENESERERFLSWVSPWQHVIENPVWVFVGEGTAIEYASRRGRTGSALLDRSDMPSHSFFAAAYYNFGMISAFLQLMIFGGCFLMIRRKIRFAKRFDQSQITMWHSALLSWTALFIWAATGHGMVTDARGMIVQFFLLGTFIAFGRIMGDGRQVRIEPQVSSPNHSKIKAY